MIFPPSLSFSQKPAGTHLWLSKVGLLLIARRENILWGMVGILVRGLREGVDVAPVSCLGRRFIKVEQSSEVDTPVYRQEDQGEATVVVSKEAAVTLMSQEGWCGHCSVCLHSDSVAEWSVLVLVHRGCSVVLSDVDDPQSCSCATRKCQHPANGTRPPPGYQRQLSLSPSHSFNRHL